MANHITLIEFLLALYPDLAGLGRLLLRTAAKPTGKQRSSWLHTVLEMADKALRFRPSREALFSVPLHDPQKALDVSRERWAKRRDTAVLGCEDSVVAVPAFWVDVDVAGRLEHCPPGRAAAWTGAARKTVPTRPAGRALPPDRAAALELLKAVGPPASIVVATGGGFQCYWLLRELWKLETRQDREQAKGVLRRVQGAVHAAARESGWTVDHRGDLARLMRLPDTLNLKYKPARPVKVLSFPLVFTPGAGRDGDHRYAPEDFAHLDEPPPAEPGASLFAEAFAGGAPQPSDLAPMFQGCAFLEHCEAQAHRLPPKLWRLLIRLLIHGVLGRLQGHQVAHILSERHNGYSREKTDEQIDQARREEPAACSRVHAAWGRASRCGDCDHFGKIKSPLELGAAGIGAAGIGAAGIGAVTDRPAAPSPGPWLSDVAPGPAAPRTAPAEDGPVPIRVTSQVHEVNSQALAALAARERNLFERGGRLVSVHRPRRGANATRAALVHPVHEARMVELLSAHCAFYESRSDSGGSPKKPVRPPRWTVRSLLHRGAWPGLPSLAGVTECPVLRADGSLLQRPGYDPESGFLYAASEEVHTVPAEPDSGTARRAWEELREAVQDFPFAGDADRAAWLAALLTPLARAAFAGPAPLHLVDADVAGCGKSLLVDVISTLVTGRPAPRMPLPRREAELGRAITHLALEACPLVLLDNVTGPFGSPTLDRALTADLWRDPFRRDPSRPGAGAPLPLTMTWYATGNDVEPAGDTPRRCLHIRLEARGRRPETRGGFAHPRLLAWLRRERPRLLPAALTILRAYLGEGRPDQGLSPWGSFEGWSDVVRSSVVWLGLPDPAAGRHRLQAAAGAETAILRDFVLGLEEVLALLGGAATTRQITDELARGGPDAHPRLRAALAEHFLGVERGALPSTHELAGLLRAYRGRVVGGACIDRLPKSWRGARWRVRRVGVSRQEGGRHAA